MILHTARFLLDVAWVAQRGVALMHCCKPEGMRLHTIKPMDISTRRLEPYDKTPCVRGTAPTWQTPSRTSCQPIQLL